MRTFAFRITARFALLVTITTAAVLVIGGILLDRQVERSLDLLHEVEARELYDMIGGDASLGPAAIAARIKADSDGDAGLFVMQVENQQGGVLFRSGNLGDTILSADAGRKQHWTTALPSVGRAHLSVFSLGPWRIFVGSPLEPSERLLRDYVRISLPLLLGAALASIALGYAFSRATLRPIRAIEATANRIRADNLSERIPVAAGRDELAALTRLLNQMFDRLQESFTQVGQFTADVSHELKTPLALIRLNAEKLRTRAGADAESVAAAADILEEIGRLHQVIDRLLFLAKSESGAFAPALRPVAMQPLIAAFAEDAQAIAEDRGVQFALERNAAGEIRADSDLLRHLLLNLVNNAVSVAPPDSRVELASAEVDGHWRFTVTDEGPGVPPEQLPRIFERFVRFDRNNTRRNGHGLGLAICKTIVELHHGSIRAENRADRSGLRVTVELPR